MSKPSIAISLDEQIQALSGRDFLLLLSAGLLVLWLLVNQLWISPTTSLREQVQSQLQQYQAQSDQLAQQLAAQGRQPKPTVRPQRPITAPVQLLETLQTLLGQQEGLRLLQLDTLPSQPLRAANSTVYRHTLQLQLQGGYAQLRDYLQRIEAQPWAVRWQQLDYQVEDYPMAHISIELQVLGTAEGLIDE